MAYTFDEAAALLDLGRNTLTKTLRELKILDRRNMPTGPYRGKGLFEVKTSTYNNPLKGPTPYSRTTITQKGVDVIRARMNKAALAISQAPQTPPANPKPEATMEAAEQLTPTGRVHDIGEMTVINEEHDRCHHRHAIVLIFDSEDQMKESVRKGVIQLVPAQDLNPDATEAMRHGR